MFFKSTGLCFRGWEKVGLISHPEHTKLQNNIDMGALTFLTSRENLCKTNLPNCLAQAISLDQEIAAFKQQPRKSLQLSRLGTRTKECASASSILVANQSAQRKQSGSALALAKSTAVSYSSETK